MQGVTNNNLLHADIVRLSEYHGNDQRLHIPLNKGSGKDLISVCH